MGTNSVFGRLPAQADEERLGFQDRTARTAVRLRQEITAVLIKKIVAEIPLALQRLDDSGYPGKQTYNKLDLVRNELVPASCWMVMSSPHRIALTMSGELTIVDYWFGDMPLLRDLPKDQAGDPDPSKVPMGIGHLTDLLAGLCELP